jgi:signal transduction histidine kinase
LDTAGRLETSLWDRIETLHSATGEAAGAGDVALVADKALEIALELTHATVAFIGLVDEADSSRQIYSRSADSAQPVAGEEIDRIFASSANGVHPVTAVDSDRSVTSFRGQPLHAGGRAIGMIGVAGAAGFTGAQRRAFTVFANQVASALEIATLQQRRREMVDTLVNLREDLDRSEKQRLITEERVHSAIRLERAHELAVEALLAVSVHAASGTDFDDFYRGLTAGIAKLVGADRVLFWQLNQDRTLTPIPGAHGIDDAFLDRLYPAPAEPYGTDLTSQVVYNDFIFRAARSGDEASQFDSVLDVLGVSSAISVPWRAGDQRLGVVAAYDSQRPDGFSMEDAWVLRMASLAAGLVWQLKLAESDLTRTIYRLQKVDEARQILLKNMTSAVDKARKRFASDLHDDALQKLTAAELQLERVRAGARGAQRSRPISEARDLLNQVEEGLRKLLFEVQPPALEAPGGFEQTIRDRVGILRSLTGIEPELDLNVSDDEPYEIKSVVFRQVAEALTNIEKHAAASTVRVVVKKRDGGIHGQVTDNGAGFVVAERDRLPGHLGLLALKERALLAGGWCEVRSTPGSGTEVEFWIPAAQ